MDSIESMDKLFQEWLQDFKIKYPDITMDFYTERMLEYAFWSGVKTELSELNRSIRERING
jgi:hypothetical protein